MGKFKYSMQNILDIKIKLETQAKNEFSEANRAYLIEKEKLEELFKKRAVYEAALKEQLSGSLNISEINICKKNINSLKSAIRTQLMNVKKAEDMLEVKRVALNELMKNDADLAKELSISEDELCSWQSQLKVTNVVSLDEFDESGPEPVMDAAHNSHYAQPEEIVTQEELKTMLVKSLDNLTEKERRVIELYYYEDLTLKEISNILEVSESRVSQLHTKGLIKMRKVMGPYMNILTNA